jgi:hypothetical protein
MFLTRALLNLHKSTTHKPFRSRLLKRNCTPRLRLVVHLGAAKCGSSALSWYLADNRSALRRNGVLVPGKLMDFVSDVDGHHVWFFENLRPYEAEQQRIFSNRLARLRAAAEGEGLNTIIISAANLINPGGFHRLFTTVDKLFDPKFIVYIRRQDDYIISAWQQWYLKRGDSFERFLADNVGKVANWYNQLLPWEEAVGRDRITVRRYGSRYFRNGDVVDDFITTTALNSEGCTALRPTHNRSFDEAIGRMASRIPDVFKDIHDNNFYNTFVYAIGEKAFKSRKGSSLLSYQQRLEILDAYASSNGALKAKYFPDLPDSEPLFQPPDPADAVTLTPEQQRDEEHNLLIRAVYRMAEKLQALEQASAVDADGRPARKPLGTPR